MTIMVAISEAAKASADALVASGRFDTVEEAIEVSLDLLNGAADDAVVRLADLSSEDRAAVENGLAAFEAGDVVDGEEFFDRLSAEYRAMIVS